MVLPGRRVLPGASRASHVWKLLQLWGVWWEVGGVERVDSRGGVWRVLKELTVS
jgi:hypothetical protein